MVHTDYEISVNYNIFPQIKLHFPANHASRHMCDLTLEVNLQPNVEHSEQTVFLSHRMAFVVLNP